MTIIMSFEIIKCPQFLAEKLLMTDVTSHNINHIYYRCAPFKQSKLLQFNHSHTISAVFIIYQNEKKFRRKLEKL